MNLIHRFLVRLGDEPLPDEVARLKSLAPHEFDIARAKHLKRRAWPKENMVVGSLFLIAMFGAPICLIKGLAQGDMDYVAAAGFWFLVAFAAYSYLAIAAGYWREHRAIIFEERNRYGKSSFS
jgi:hypothetical protein